MKSITLPENWKLLPTATLFCDYARPSLRRGNEKVIKEIAGEFTERLEKKGYVKAPGIGWIFTEDLNLGLEMGAIKQVNGEFSPVAEETTQYVNRKLRGRKVGIEEEVLDMSKYREWCAIVRRNEKNRSRKEFAIQKQFEELEKQENGGNSK